MGRGHITSSLHHTCTCRPQYMPLQLISAHCPPAQASHNCSHSCVCASFFPPHRKILYETLPCFPIPRLTWCHALRSCFSIQPGNGKTGQGYIQNFSVGVGKIMHIELFPLGGLGVCSPREVLKFTCPEAEHRSRTGMKCSLYSLNGYVLMKRRNSPSCVCA